MHQDGSSFEWHQPCKNLTALQLHHLGGYSKHAVKKNYSHSFRVTCDKSTVSLLETENSAVYIYIKVINNTINFSLDRKHSSAHRQCQLVFISEASCGNGTDAVIVDIIDDLFP